VNDARSVALVSLGGAIGTLARYGTSELAPVAAGTFPTTTLLINALGAFALGLLVGILARWRPDDTVLRPLLGIGVLGAFTTFSTLAVENAQLLRADQVWTAAAYGTTSIVLGLLAAALGLRIAGVRPSVVSEGES
jgi:fluoride exporter